MRVREGARCVSAMSLAETTVMAFSSCPTQTVPFMARCPKCGYDSPQDGYTGEALLELLRAQPSIKAVSEALVE